MPMVRMVVGAGGRAKKLAMGHFVVSSMNAFVRERIVYSLLLLSSKCCWDGADVAKLMLSFLFILSSGKRTPAGR